MKKFVTLVAILILGAASAAWAETREAVQNRMDNAATVVHEIMGAPDKGIPEEVLEHAKCVAVVPRMIKAGLVFGGENGRGLATCRTANGWSAPAFFAITGGNWGLQIGVEGVDLIMVFQGEKGCSGCFPATSNLEPTPLRQPGQLVAMLPPIPTGRWIRRFSPTREPRASLPDLL